MRIGEAFITAKQFIHSHGTKVIGYVTGTISAVAGVSGIIPESHLKYYMAAIAVLTVWRGFINTANKESK